MNHLTKSKEDYLEGILMLKQMGGKVKSSELARLLTVSKPAVNKAMEDLKKDGLVSKSNYGDIFLTEMGERVAATVLEKHLLIEEFLLELGVSKANAKVDCCKIEHVISDETLACIRKFMNSNPH